MNFSLYSFYCCKPKFVFKPACPSPLTLSRIFFLDSAQNSCQGETTSLFCLGVHVQALAFRCKIFYKKGASFVDKGVGMLHLKPVEGSNKTQLLVRAETSLGNILLNIMLNKQVSLSVLFDHQKKFMALCICSAQLSIVESRMTKQTLKTISQYHLSKKILFKHCQTTKNLV